MARNTFAFLALIPALTLGFMACTGEQATVDEEAVVEQESEIVAPERDLFGTYRNQYFRLGSLALLVLKSDGTYHRGTVVGCSTSAPCTPAADDGAYMLWARSGETYVSLYPDDGGRVDRFQYVLKGEMMRITRLGEGNWMTLAKTINASWCGEPVDCTVQNLPVGPCAGEWYCAHDVCGYSCGAPPVEE